MSNLIVNGGTPLSGRIVPSANKNAVLPILCATLLTREPVRLVGIPEITDVKKILEIFRQLGSHVEVDFQARVLEVHHRDTRFDEAVHRLPEEMRSSIMLVPGLLARFGVARIEDDVKGCSLGMREIDPHVEVMQSFGARVERRPDGIVMRAERTAPASYCQSVTVGGRSAPLVGVGCTQPGRAARCGRQHDSCAGDSQPVGESVSDSH